MTRPSLAGIEKRAAEATEGPWAIRAEPDGDEDGYATLAHTDEWSTPYSADEDVWFPAGTPANAEFIAHARTDLDALTAAVRDVLALHREDGHGECSHCPDPSDAHWSAPYPCPTVRALATHLDLTDPEGEPT